MSKTARNVLLKYGSAFAFVAVYVVGYLQLQDMSQATLKDWYRVLCDAFTLPGLLMVFSGALIWLSGEGAFNGIGFCMKAVVDFLIPGRRLLPREKYADHVERKRGNRMTGYGFLFICGAVTVAVSLVLLVLFHNA